MAESYKIGPNLVGAIYDVIQAKKDAGGGRPPPTRLPTTFGEGPPEFRGIRIGTFDTAAWSIGTDNTVTLTNVGVTGYTVLATNIFGSIPSAGATQNCAIAKDGTAWYLIQPFISTAGGSLVRMGTFSSPWAKGATKTINLTNAGGTVAASNTLIDYPSAPVGKSTVNCVVANDGGTWFLANWEQATATAAFISAVSTAAVVTDVTLSATLNTSSCAITIGKTNTTALVTFIGTSYTTSFIKLS